jgi:N-acetylglucosamine kinase-like BadF-type ATPase
MIRLIADSGSTKADWRLTGKKGGLLAFQSPGINPYYQDGEEILQALRENILPQTGPVVDEIFFYGAGVVSGGRGDFIKQAFHRLFPEARVEVHTDLLGAARALFGCETGIVCILGTGSNACLYDGSKITHGVPPLGFILGDEGSGAVLGRKLVGDFFKEIMPQELRSKFEQQFVVTQSEVLNRVYRSEYPNRYLAGFTPFLSQNLAVSYCRELFTKSMDEFMERNVLQLPDAVSRKIGFVGSVAFHCSELIGAMAESYGFKNYRILKEPIAGLIEFHTEK